MKKVVLFSMIGNTLEWYDFTLYAQFTYIISQKFFPDSSISQILTLAIFAIGFVVRPLGGIVFGSIGDRFGRRVSLAMGILSMVIPTTLIGLLPDYNTIGIAAPIILAIARLVQGFSLGGEFSGCVVYITEHAPADKRGLAGSVVYTSQCLGMLLGLVVAYLLNSLLSKEDLYSWGWRIPFICSVFIGIVGFYIRNMLVESPIYVRIQNRGMVSESPLKELVLNYKKSLLFSICIYVNVTASFYAATIFIQNYMLNLGYTEYQSLGASALTLAVMIISFPAAAYISDKIGRKPILIISCIAMIISIYPLFLAINTKYYYLALLSQVLFSIIVASHMGSVPTILVETFPTNIRFTGVALSSNLSAAIFGGTVPVIGATLYHITGNQLAISYYLTFIAVFALVVVLFYKETYKKVI